MLCIGLILTVILSTTFAARIDLNVPDNNYCYAEDDNPFLYFATKTSYDFIHGADWNQHIIPDCKPVQFWGFNRHGTRLPSDSSISQLQSLESVKEQVLNNYKNLVPNSKVGRLCEKDLDLLKGWKWNTSITEDTENMLTSEGWEELKQMAIRYKKWYPELLDVPYSKQNFEFIWTSSERTESSFHAYAQGLFGNDYLQAEGRVNDTLLKAYKTCKKWKETVDDNPDTYIEVYKFLASPAFQNVISEVSARLGFKKALNKVLIDNIYDMCRYEQAWNPHKKSPWCSAFTKEHLEIIEYAEDLSYYANNGYAIEMNSKIGCLPLKDLMEKLEIYINGNRNQPKVSVYFTHSSALQLLMNAMSMNKDDLPLTADTMDQHKYRMWRLSFMVPFAANLNAVLYKCDKGDENRIMFLLNEKRAYYPGCHEGVCSWEFLKQKLSTVTQSCNLDFCNE